MDIPMRMPFIWCYCPLLSTSMIKTAANWELTEHIRLHSYLPFSIWFNRQIILGLICDYFSNFVLFFMDKQSRRVGSFGAWTRTKRDIAQMLCEVEWAASPALTSPKIRQSMVGKIIWGKCRRWNAPANEANNGGSWRLHKNSRTELAGDYPHG